MKNWMLIFCLVAASCQQQKQPAGKQDTTATIAFQTEAKTVKASDREDSGSFKPFKLVDDYLVTDTGYFDFTMGNGTYAVVKRNGTLIDTIDFAYSMQKVDNDSYMYALVKGMGALKENTGKSASDSIQANIGDYVIVNDHNKINLNKSAPDFGWFASPAIINHKVYYWQVKRTGNGNRVSAAEFDPITKATKSFYVANDDIETDDAGYFEPALLKKDTIFFKFNDQKVWKFSPSFKPYQ